MTKHTPGGWSRNIKPASKYPVIFAGRNTHVATIISRGLPEDQVEANCDLIAAAPDLLAALKNVTAALERVLPRGRLKHEQFAQHPDLVEARAAIAKAEGRL